jgi:hypothetical protein
MEPTGAVVNARSTTSTASTKPTTPDREQLLRQMTECGAHITDLSQQLRSARRTHDELRQQLTQVCEHHFVVDRSQSDPCSRSYVCVHCFLSGHPAAQAVQAPGAVTRPGVGTQDNTLALSSRSHRKDGAE